MLCALSPLLEIPLNGRRLCRFRVSQDIIVRTTVVESVNAVRGRQPVHVKKVVRALWRVQKVLQWGCKNGGDLARVRAQLSNVFGGEVRTKGNHRGHDLKVSREYWVESGQMLRGIEWKAHLFERFTFLMPKEQKKKKT